MMTSKKKVAAIDVAAPSLRAPVAADSARKHFMLSSAARREVKTRSSSLVELASAFVLLDVDWNPQEKLPTRWASVKKQSYRKQIAITLNPVQGYQLSCTKIPHLHGEEKHDEI